MKYQTINAGDHFGRLETLERIKIGRRIMMIFFELPLVLVYLCFPATYCIADIIERLKSCL